jgi:glycosyltransferase involved in cell wall biosynthesis
MSLLKFSLIIPTFEEEKIIAETLESYQNFRSRYSFEIIVSDGNSYDNTRKIAKPLCDKLVVTENEIRNISSGRNLGADCANSNLLVFINADSLPSDFNKFFETISQIADNRIYSKYSAFACKILPFPKEQLTRDLFFYSFFNNYFKLLNIIGVGMGRGECQIIRKEVFDNVGKYNNEIYAGEDFDLFRRVARNGKIKFLDEVVIFESTRRFRKVGYLKTLWLWFVNSIFVMLFNKSLSKEWEAVR